MRLFNKLILAVTLAAASLGVVSAAPGTTQLNVHVRNGADVALGSVTVAAIQFGMNGPSTYTLVAQTNASGNAVFTIKMQMGYNIVVSSQGFSPTIAEQFNNPEYNPNKNVWAMTADPVYSTFTLTPGLTDVARIKLEIANATPNTVLFGGIYNMLAQQQDGSGIVMTDNSGNGFLIVDNVPFADANTYNIGIYDPYLNRGTGRNVMTDLATVPFVDGVRTLSYTGAAKADFNNSIPPSRVENASAGGGSSVSSTTVEGILRSTQTLTTDPWSPIPHMGISFRSCNNGLWANADQNGRFQLSNLTVGATYYAETMGGCAWSNNGNGACYAPYSSPALAGNQDLCSGLAARGENDFVYVSSALPIFQGVASPSYHDSLKIQLDEMAESTGSFKVCVKSPAGQVIPNSNVNINADGSPWPKTATACQGTVQANYTMLPGFAMKNFNTGANGCATITGLPTGNYVVNVWTPFSNNSGGQSSFNSGEDGSPAWGMNSQPCSDQSCWLQSHCRDTGVNDYRVYIETNPAQGDNQMLHVYNSSNVLVTDGIVNLSSITYVVQAAGNASGLVRGVIKFPSAVDLSNNPIVITLFPQCSGMGSCGTGNFTSVTGSGKEIPYTLTVSSGFAYYMNTASFGWGRVRRGGGNNQVNLQSTGTVVIDMDFEPAGTITGTLYKPDGTVFSPSNNQYIWVDANTDRGWTGTQVQKDGTFTMSDALSGINRIQINASGDSSSGNSFNYALPTPAPTVTLSAGSTSTLNINLVNATYVGIALNPAMTPDASVMTSDYDTILGFKVVPLPAGTVLKGETISNMLLGKDDRLEFRYSTGTLPMQEGPCGQGWPGGFCATAMPSPTVYDLYLMRSGDFGNMEKGPQPNMPYPHFSLLTSSKNVIIDSAHANQLVRPAYSMSFSTGVKVNLTPSTDMSARGNATLFGQVTANNFFRQGDYDSLGGNFDDFVRYLPVVALYDANGSFKAAGIVVPPPAFIAQKEATGAFQGAFAAGFSQFKTMLAEAPYFGYEIRGLAPSTCYTAVVTTPNYPPYQARTCVGVNGSTTTMTINLDDAVGAGATLQGVVTTTNTPVRLSNVTVELVGESIDPRSVVTDSTGAYKFEGLPKGAFRLKVSADGYALSDAEKELTGTNVYTQNFALTAAGGSLTGTVYSQKLPFAKVQAGAALYAYDDTYNGTNPTAPLPLLKARTGSDGTYVIKGLVPGHVYKVFLKVPGKYTLNQTATATAGLLTGVDFTMLPKPLDIEVFAKMNTERNIYEFTILNPQDFKTGFINWGEAPFDPAHVSTVTMTKLSSGELHGEVPLGPLVAGKTYVLQGAAVSYSGKSVVREVLFGKGLKGNATQNIDDAILGDDSDDGYGRKSNEAPLDKSGDDPSALSFPPGVLQPVSTAAIPSCTFTGTGKDDASVADKVAALGADAFAGNLYTVAMSSVATNESKDFELTLAYDKTTANLNDLAVSQFNTTTSKWEEVPGVATVNPVKGTVKVKLKKLASVLNVRAGAAPMGVFDGRQYVVRPQTTGGGSSSGTFAVVRPSVAGDPFTGSKMKVFNYPNPFSLKLKTVTAHNHDAGNLPTLSTNGTFIHVEVPAANGGACHIRIYTLAGELVNDLSNTCVGGKYNYFEWNGHNKGGQEVANGVYYGIVELSGKAPNLKDATFKMAVIK
jgi:hypothetical protein